MTIIRDDESFLEFKTEQEFEEYQDLFRSGSPREQFSLTPDRYPCLMFKSPYTEYRQNGPDEYICFYFYDYERNENE